MLLASLLIASIILSALSLAAVGMAAVWVPSRVAQNLSTALEDQEARLAEVAAAMKQAERDIEQLKHEQEVNRAWILTARERMMKAGVNPGPLPKWED